MPDPLTVLNHCNAGALDESAAKQASEKIRIIETTNCLVIGNTGLLSRRGVVSDYTEPQPVAYALG
jgi:hypothetical protein